MRLIRLVFFLFLTGCTTRLAAQEISWADGVISFSSEYSNAQYSAEEATGPPDVWPATESSAVAWSPRWPDKGEEYIRLSFGRPVLARQVLIIQSFNPGAVSRVLLEGAEGKQWMLYPDEKSLLSEVDAPILRLRSTAPFPIVSAAVFLNTATVEGYNHIDAVGLSEQEGEAVPDFLVSSDFNGRKVVPIGRAVNSEYSEVHPVPGPGDSVLFFTRKKHPANYGAANRDDIWYSVKENGVWQKARNAGAPANNTGHNHLNAYIPRSGYIWCAGHMGGSTGRDQIYRLQWNGGVSSAPEAVRIRNFYNVSPNTSFHVSADEKVMILSLQRKDSRGSKDLYVSFRGADSLWTEPVNIGQPVNTVADEVTPYLSANGRQLYFASRGHTGYGDFDIYRTERLDDSWLRWSMPVNLGSGINTAGWEAYFSVSAKEKNGPAYFVRYLEGRASDVFELPEKQKGKRIRRVKIYVSDRESGRELSARIRASLGTNTWIPEGNELQIEERENNSDPIRLQVTAEGYFAATAIIDSNVQDEMYIALYPLRKGVIVPIEHLFFEANNARIKSSSFPALDELARFLKDHKDLKVEIAGHTNNLCSSSYCLQLSEDRARSVMRYLTDHGVPASQLIAKGYGKSQPIDSNETEEGRKRNQRVEVRILEME